MHRHFADFDTFLVELVRDRTARLDAPARALSDAAGTGRVVDNLSHTLTAVFTPLAVAMVALVITRDGLRARLREAGVSRFPLIAEGSAMVTAYLTAEQARGRVAATADISTLSHTLIGSVHLLFTDQDDGPPGTEELRKVITGVMRGGQPGSGETGKGRLQPSASA